ncbi:MAG: DNA-directed DNA polymerase II small subunit [Candidatus Helarchaeota archaeon]
MKLCSDSNLLISPETLQYVKNTKQPFEFVRKTIQEIAESDTKPLVLTIDFLKKMLQQRALSNETKILERSDKELLSTESVKLETSKEQEIAAEQDAVVGSFFSPADQTSVSTPVHIKDEVVVLKDPTGLMLGEGKIEDTKAYFLDRFAKLRKLLLKRPDCRGALTIEQAKGFVKSENPIKVIGTVLERKELSSKSNSKINEATVKSLSITIDDREDTLDVIFSGKNEGLIKKAHKIVADQVICIEGFMTEEKVLIASDIFRPDIPYHPKKERELPPISVIFISDTHVGSKYFLTDKFEAFIEWLRGNSEVETQRQLANSVKYVLVAGDLIDGVGVYPNQEKNLEIIDLTEQYNLAAEYLARIPKHIKIIIIPGGPHDVVRKAYPQPALSREYAGALFRLPNVILLGNPAQIQLHGINILMFHGDSIDDLIQVIPGLSYQKPAEIMKELIVNRHLTPMYGYSTWIAPEKEDWMVIEEIPEILHCGHTHVSDFKEYRGVILLNSGTFQAETDYQQSLGIKPSPGKIPIVNLQNLKVKFLQF